RRGGVSLRRCGSMISGVGFCRFGRGGRIRLFRRFLLFLLGGGFRRLGVRGSRLLVRIAPVIGLVETGTLEDDSGTCPEKAFHLAVAFVQRTIGEPVVLHGLEDLELMTAFLALVVV